MNRFCLVLLAVSLLSINSIAAEQPRTIPDAAEASMHGALHQLRYIKAGDPAITTSTCIGNPVTPLCAAETWFASSNYEGNDLLLIAQGRKRGGPDFQLPPPWNSYIDCYQLNGYWYYHANDFALLHSVYPIEPGDVALDFLQGRVVDGECNLDFFPGSGKTYGMLLRKGEYGWYVFKSHPMEDYVRVPYLDAHR